MGEKKKVRAENQDTNPKFAVRVYSLQAGVLQRFTITLFLEEKTNSIASGDAKLYLSVYPPISEEESKARSKPEFMKNLEKANKERREMRAHGSMEDATSALAADRIAQNKKAAAKKAKKKGGGGFIIS